MLYQPLISLKQITLLNQNKYIPYDDPEPKRAIGYCCHYVGCRKGRPKGRCKAWIGMEPVDNVNYNATV